MINEELMLHTSDEFCFKINRKLVGVKVLTNSLLLQFIFTGMLAANYII
jgi:hypothetical protein